MAEVVPSSPLKVVKDPELAGKVYIDVDKPSLEDFLESQEFDFTGWDTAVIPVHFSAKRQSAYNQKIQYGYFAHSRSISLRCAAVVLHMPAIKLATDSLIDISDYTYAGPQADISRNTSAVLVHELVHLKQEIERWKTLEARKKSFFGLGRISVPEFIDPNLGRKRERLRLLQNESEARVVTERVFKANPSIGELVKVDYL